MSQLLHFNLYKRRVQFSILGAAAAAHAGCNKFENHAASPASSREEKERATKYLDAMRIVQNALNDLYRITYTKTPGEVPSFNTTSRLLADPGLEFTEILEQVHWLLNSGDIPLLRSFNPEGDVEVFKSAVTHFQDQCELVLSALEEARSLQNQPFSLPEE